MPPKRKAAAKKVSNIAPSTALQPTSTNPLKRPLNNAHANENDEKSPPKSKRPLISSTIKPALKGKSTSGLPAAAATQSISTVTPALHTPLPWNGTGKYSVTSGACYDLARKVMAGTAIDTTGFSVKVLYCRQSFPHQVYATFSFDKLEGLMRLCPRDTSSEGKFPVAQFEDKCYLREETEPGPGHLTWAMRWRGTDGGMQANKVVGGEELSLGSFDFEEESTSPSATFAGVKINFVMIYNSQFFIFDASKISELDVKDRNTKVQPLERRWKSLYNPEWDEDSDSDSDSQPETVFRGPRSRVQVAKRPQIPRSKPIGEAPSLSSLSSPEMRPDWAWDLTGTWTLSSNMLKSRFNLDDNGSSSMKFILTNDAQSGRQLWATYKFGDALEGVMRFNPECNHGDHTRELEGFEKACVLREGVWPGPSPRGQDKWRFRFRGVDGRTKRNERTGDMSTSFLTFTVDKDGRLKFMGSITYEFQPLIIHGVKDAEDSTHESQSAVSQGALERSWQRMDSVGEDRSASASRGYSLNRLPNMPSRMPGVVDRSSPGLWKDHPGKTIIENPPDWAWNLAGHWNITAPKLSEALKLGKTECLTMKIHISNYPAHTRVGRQLWASFVFGDSLKGYMRFCPASTPNVKGCNLKQFDSACRLEEGQWAGPSEDGGHEKWLWRWRGKKGFMSYEDGSDEFQDEVEFSTGENGEYKMQAIITYGYQKMILEAVKDRESTPPKAAGTLSQLVTEGTIKKNTIDEVFLI